MSAQPPPSTNSGPPPRYVAVVSKVYPYSLRPIVIFSSFLGMLYGLAMGVESIRDRGADNETSKEKVFDIIFAIMFFVIAGIEAFAIIVAFIQSLAMGRLLLVLAPLGILTNLGVQVISVIVHFTLKTDLINQCIANETGADVDDYFGDSETISTSQATSICNSSWSRGTWGVFAWLLLSALLSLLFGSIVLSYYRQLADPSSVRQRVVAQPQAFAMQPGYYPPPPNNGQQPWMVPPYPGPPMNGAAPPPPGGYEKGDYHPEAPWAQSEVPYAPPSGPPPSSQRAGISANREEDEAWERAQSQGVTAHLTGQGSNPFANRTNNDSTSQGYVISNNEEDEAWERARSEGFTAHLTGHNNNVRNREGEV